MKPQELKYVCYNIGRDSVLFSFHASKQSVSFALYANGMGTFYCPVLYIQCIQWPEATTRNFLQFSTISNICELSETHRGGTQLGGGEGGRDTNGGKLLGSPLPTPPL